MKMLVGIVCVACLLSCDDKLNGGNIQLTGANDSTIYGELAKDAEINDFKILPVDESDSDPSLKSFIDNLKSIVSSKDTAALYKTMDASVIVSHGGGISGISEFAKYWSLKRPENSELWKVLERLLNLGGTWENGDGRYFCIPYANSSKAFARFNRDFDWYQTAVCLSSNASVFNEPKVTASIVSTLNHEIVEVDVGYMRGEYAKVKSINSGIEGYVKSSDLFFTSDQHLVIEKVDGEWKVTAFAPFD